MRIAHVLSSLRIGGQEKMVQALATAQQGRGHHVTVVSLGEQETGGSGEAGVDKLAPWLVAAGITVVRVPKGAGLDPTLTWRLCRQFRAGRTEVVHSHNRQPLLYAPAAARLAGATAIHTRHGPGIGRPGERWARRLASRFLHAYVAVSPDTAAIAWQAGDCSRENVLTIENGVDTEAFTPSLSRRREVRAELGIPVEAWVFGTVGRLAVEKNYELLLRAAAPLLGPQRRLLLVGDGAEAASLRALAARLPTAPYIHFTGSRQDVPRLLAAFDLFALSSRMEGLPLVILESMSSGLPVVATAVGGIPGVVQEGQTGHLVPAGDEAGLRAALQSLVDDPERARTMGGKARQRVQEVYSLDRMVDRYLGLYRMRRGLI